MLPAFLRVARLAGTTFIGLPVTIVVLAIAGFGACWLACGWRLLRQEHEPRKPLPRREHKVPDLASVYLLTLAQ